MGLQVSLHITARLEHLRDSGSAKSFTKTFDFCGKFLGVSGKNTEKTAIRHTVSEATFVDAAGGKVNVAVWDQANQWFDSLDIGRGVLVLGCNATVQDGEVKLNIWPGAHISTSGEQAQSLTRLYTETLTRALFSLRLLPKRLPDIVLNLVAGLVW